jgi:hypothetical protein
MGHHRKELSKTMRALKGIVIGMAILIVIGLGGVGYGIYKNASSLGKKSSTASPENSTSKIIEAWPQDLSISLPPGCFIQEVETEDNRMYVIISGTSQDGKAVCSRVIVVNPASGKRLGTLKVVP